MPGWNPWHGCRKLSAGCRHCYVYRMDALHGKDSSIVTKTRVFNLPARKNRRGDYALPPGSTVYTCFTSDFFLEEADGWRPEAWAMMRQRPDLHFFLITKRIHRLAACVPPDWGDGYEHVTIGCTVENQDRAAYRLPLYQAAPILHKELICAPLLERLDLSAWLGPWLEGVSAGGEAGPEARVCDYAWVLDIRRQCVERGVPFHFQQTGARFAKDGRVYRIPRRLQRSQAAKANIDWTPGKKDV